MPKSERQKLKTLYVAKYFLDYSDENHPITAGDIADYLSTEYGITAERRSIYRDIATLRDEFGLEIVGTKGGRYRLLSRQFHLDDLRLLAECVHAAKFISAAKAKELVETIGELCSRYQAEQLQQEVFLPDRVKTTQRGTLNIISTIRAAMVERQDGKPHTPQKISFKYLKYDLDHIPAQIEKHNGQLYKVSPFQMLINEGNYYLLASDDKSRELRTYRIDRMKDVNVIDEAREGEEAFAEIDMKTYVRRVFSMFNGEHRRVTMCFSKELLDTAVERFGTGVDTFYISASENQFTVSTDVSISNQFFGWICGLGDLVKILSPVDVVERFKAYLAQLQAIYE